MYETDEDLARVQRLLDESFARAGQHLLSISTPERRLTAAQLAELLVGVQVLNLATVSAKGEPRVGAVDGLFFRGTWYFGTSPDSVRFRHLTARPAVSANHVRGEELAVTVHGRAVPFDRRSPEQEATAAYFTEVYGAWWDGWAPTEGYFWIDPSHLFTFGTPAT